MCCTHVAHVNMDCHEPTWGQPGACSVRAGVAAAAPALLGVPAGGRPAGSSLPARLLRVGGGDRAAAAGRTAAEPRRGEVRRALLGVPDAL